jgi:hypothetical protein
VTAVPIHNIKSSNNDNVDIGKGDTGPIVRKIPSDAVGKDLPPKRNESERGKSTTIIIIITITTKPIMRVKMIFQRTVITTTTTTIEEEKTFE